MAVDRKKAKYLSFQHLCKKLYDLVRRKDGEFYDYKNEYHYILWHSIKIIKKAPSILEQKKAEFKKINLIGGFYYKAYDHSKLRMPEITKNKYFLSLAINDYLNYYANGVMLRARSEDEFDEAMIEFNQIYANDILEFDSSDMFNKK